MEEKKNGLNQKEKRTLLVVSLAIVIALVFGISYAYFMAVGQSAEQTITTSNIALSFDDNTAIVNANNIEPITANKFKIEGAKKHFTLAKRTGSDDLYAKIELTDIAISDNLKDYDFKWALYQGETKISTGTFVQAMSSNRITLANNVLLNSTTPIPYDLYIWIDETGLIQNDLMGGSLKTKITVTGSKEKVNTLGSVILGENNANVTLTAPTFTTSSTDRGLFVQQADSETDEKSEYGFPTYYFRGSSENETINSTYKMNNYVKFGVHKNDVLDTNNTVIANAGDPIIWRIVRINEDGSIRLITENNVGGSHIYNSNGTANYINNYGTDNETNSEIKSMIEQWYTSNITESNLDDKVITSTFCNDTTTTNGIKNPVTRLTTNKAPIYTCPNGSILANEKVGLITADEIMFAGSSAAANNTSYLNNNTNFRTMTPSIHGVFMWYTINMSLDQFNPSNSSNTGRAVINLSPDVIVSGGDGLSAKTAYTIDTRSTSNPKTVTLTAKAEYQDNTSHAFSKYLSTLPDNSTVKLDNGTYNLTLISSYNLPKNLKIIGSENTIINNFYINAFGTSHETVYVSDSNMIEGLNLYNLKFTDTGIYSNGNLKNVIIDNCTFENGASILLATSTFGINNVINENVTIKNNNFSGTNGNNSGITLTNTTGLTTVEGNSIDGGRHGVLLNNKVAGTSNIINNTISNTNNAAFRIARVQENATINVTKNIVNNAIKTSTGAIARIGDNSDLPASATINFTDNTYDGAVWPNSTWSNIQGEFGINASGVQVES